MSEDARRTVTTHLGGDAVIIPNGVFVDRFSGAEPRPEWQGTPERPTICFLGRMQESRKGLHVLLDAVPEMLRHKPGLRVLVAGPGDAKQVLAGRPREVVDAVEMLGAVSDEDKARLFASADIYIAPNTGGESFGIILIEAMSAGAPVLASDLGAFTRVLDEGRVGATFRNEDPADLARAAVALLDDPDRRSELSRLGREHARRFDWSVVTQDILMVYETAIEAWAPPRTGRWRRGGNA